jgi:hypothetical protein
VLVLGTSGTNQQPGLCSCLGALDVLQRAQRLAQPAQGLRVAPDAQRHDRFLLDEAGVLDWFSRERAP